MRAFWSAVVAVVLVAPFAHAQFGPAVRYNFGFGIGPNVPRNPWLPQLPTVPGYYNMSAYTLSGVGMNGPYSVSYGYYRLQPSVVVPVYNNYYSPGITGGVGMGGSGVSPRVVDKQKNAIAAAQKAAKWDTSANTAPKDFDRFLKDQEDRRIVKDPDAPPVLDAKLINPPEDQILNGQALNELVLRIAELEAKGKKAASGQCAPELLTGLVFEGGPAADAANLFRTTDLAYPTPFMNPMFEDLRAQLDKAYSPVASAAHAGKKVADADADKLHKEAVKAHESITAATKDAPIADAQLLTAFFNRLESAAKYVKAADATGVAGTKWSTLGAGVNELVKHVQKYKLRFGPAADGDEASYFALHRGLLAYYAGLIQAK